MISTENIQHVVFDFDGVIIDSERQKFADLKDILNTYNYNLNDSEFRNFVGKKRGQFLKEKKITHIDEIMKKAHKLDQIHTDLPLIDGVKQFLMFLKNKNIKMHIATGSSKEFVLFHLDKHAICSYFSQILTGDDIKESKPHPKIYLEIKKRLDNQHIIVIEDSPVGVQSAKQAGLCVIGLGNSTGADTEFLTYNQIRDYLESK